MKWSALSDELFYELRLIIQCFTHYVFLCLWALAQHVAVSYIVDRLDISMIGKLAFSAYMILFDLYVLVFMTLCFYKSLKALKVNDRNYSMKKPVIRASTRLKDMDYYDK